MVSQSPAGSSPTLLAIYYLILSLPHLLVVSCDRSLPALYINMHEKTFMAQPALRDNFRRRGMHVVDEIGPQYLPNVYSGVDLTDPCIQRSLYRLITQLSNPLAR